MGATGSPVEPHDCLPGTWDRRNLQWGYWCIEAARTGDGRRTGESPAKSANARLNGGTGAKTGRFIGGSVPTAQSLDEGRFGRAAPYRQARVLPPHAARRGVDRLVRAHTLTIIQHP